MPRKILDIAKDLGIGPYDFVEEVKKLNIAPEVNRPTDIVSDEIANEIIAKLKPEAAAEKAPAKSPKTAVRRKVVRKTATATSEETPSEDAPKKTTVRKRVIRRKAHDASEEENVKVAEVKTEAPVEKQVEEKAEEAPATVEKKASALKIVSVPKKEETEVKAEAPKAQVKEEVPRPHFGLRVVKKADPKPEKKEEENSAEKIHHYTQNHNTARSGEGEEDDDKKGKKLGGLAAMMSSKKNVSRASHLQQVKAEEEMKSYSALSSLGRPIYTQIKKKKEYSGPSMSTIITEMKDSKKVVQISGAIMLEDLAKKLKVKFKELKDKVLDINLLVKHDDYVGCKLASQIAELYGYHVEDVSFNEDEALGVVELTDEQIEKLPLRNPVITIMGHVDHGKTTLLDYIRNAKVASGEAGGITQHIGAYTVKVKGQTLTFLDTPGHAAFASMRQRGADVTDVVVLVVAADDGVMPQTRESIKFCEQAGKQLIVAINKMDKDDINPDRIKAELAELNITPEEWGGNTQFIPISAKKGDGVDDLLEAIALQAEMMELRADPKGHAQAAVIESKIEQGRGPVATILVQSGTLKKGDAIVVGETYGRARSLMNERGEQLKEAGPSTPVQIIGLNEAPTPGDQLYVVDNEREAKRVATNRINERKELEATPVKKKLTLEDFFATSAEADKEDKTLNLIIRSDVQGSYEAVKQALESLGNDEVKVKVIGGGAGPITDSDVMMASSAEGFIIGFNMRPVTTARRLAEEKGIDIKTYSVIYELINDVTLALEGLLDPETAEEYIGRAEVKDTFSIPKVGTIAGSQVIDGKIAIGCNIRLLRQGKIVFDGKMSSLKRFKDDAKEVKNGFECGIGLENFNDIKVGDVFEAYNLVEKKRKLETVEI